MLGITLGTMFACAPAPKTSETVDGYVALVPGTLRAGETASFSFTLFNGQKLADSAVTVSVMSKDKSVLASAQGDIDGNGTLALAVPRVEPGEYVVKVTGQGFAETTPVQIEPGTLLFLESDKPIYKPGQTVHVRLVALDSELKPVATEAVIEIQDAKAIKVFKKTVTTDEYGMATIDLPLSTEPNLGGWKLTATAGQATTQLDVRVEEYVLPKYEVKADMGKDWFLVNEQITGHVTAQYSFGRMVKGQLKVAAYRYVGEWEKYATYEAQIDGQGDFHIEAPGYVAGVPEAGGEGNVRLDISVAETSTGYEQTTTDLITVAAAPLNIQLIPESGAFKPTLPFGVIIVTETPGGEPVEARVKVDVSYLDETYNEIGRESKSVDTSRGTGLLRLAPPAKAVRMSIYANSGDAGIQKEVTAAYSPSGNFIHVQQQGNAALSIGDTARFAVLTTAEARNFYYEVVSRGRVVFTGTTTGDIAFKITPAMAPQARLLVYQILPNSEVAADAIPFDVTGEYPQTVSASFSTQEARPGDKVQVNVQTEGPAKVGLVAVDRSVFILAENRLNLEQVFAELEALYMQPQAELDQGEWIGGGPLLTPGAEDTFKDAGLIVLSNKKVPQGKEIEAPQVMFDDMRGEAAPAAGQVMTTAAAATTTTGIAGPKSNSSGDLADVQRVRQFFPETWIWDEAITDESGKATLDVTAPDSITTWDLRAVAVSPSKGLGISETSLRVFQPFFLQADLPYSSIRGEEFPVKIALYNYLDSEQKIQVDLEGADWFDLLGASSVTVTVAPNEVGSAEFKIRPKSIGTQLLKVTARSKDAADAVNKSMIVEPEGVPREEVQNLVVPAGTAKTLQLTLPQTGVVADSARSYVAVTGSSLAQTIEGLDQLLQMPFGCGEQNMILFAPDTFILKYLKGTRQLKPEVQAKAEMLLITGYQRELTYRHNDGSFSAFGEQDDSGSLWLTAFVLKTFSQAKGLTFVDPDVLTQAAGWIKSQQKSDGSFESVGFIHHEDMMGGVKGKDTLTAFVAIALLEAGETDAANKAIGYLEGRVSSVSDPYALALTTYALELAKSPAAPQAMTKLMAAAIADENGLHWSNNTDRAQPYTQGNKEGSVGQNGAAVPPAVEPLPIEPRPIDVIPSLDIEATGYATLALIQSDNRVDASRAAKWLVGQRNSQGGFGSTQDTVVALQALTEYSTMSATDTAMTVTLKAGNVTKEIKITPDNFDVTQVVEVPAGVSVELSADGKGEAVVQGVLRYNLPEAEKTPGVFDIKVDYNTSQVAVNDLIDIHAGVTFNPPEPLKAGMVVVDISVPTGFAAVNDSLAKLLEQKKIKRYDVAGRKVIVYIEDMSPGDTVSFAFQAQALYPVKAKSTVSSAYSYYTPDWRGETLGQAVTVQ
jgi:CD109 antigen